ncbi:hypothetical protein J0H58_30995 [bacterium]|nr:hypothetical protein [bacterium]
MNTAIELHDSAISAVFESGSTVVVRLSPAYVHRSTGRPGIDPGTGWVQEVELRFANGVIECPLTDLPCTLGDGFVTGGIEFRNAVPLPLSVESEVRFEARTVHGERLVVRGSGLDVSPVTDAKYVEEFPGHPAT